MSTGRYSDGMGPISAVAIAIFLFVFGFTEGGWITASPKFIGVVAIVVAIVVLIDTFYGWHRHRTPPA